MRESRVRRLFVFVVLVLLAPTAGLRSLAYATPSDPSWISGVYDGADYDDVVLLTTSEAGAVTPSLLPVFLQVAVRIPPLAREGVSTATLSTFQSRAPPA